MTKNEYLQKVYSDGKALWWASNSTSIGKAINGALSSLARCCALQKTEDYKTAVVPTVDAYKALLVNRTTITLTEEELRLVGHVEFMLTQ